MKYNLLCKLDTIYDREYCMTIREYITHLWRLVYVDMRQSLCETWPQVYGILEGLKFSGAIEVNEFHTLRDYYLKWFTL